MNNTLGIILCALVVTLSGGSTRFSHASPLSTFPTFPQSCAEQAYEFLGPDRADPNFEGSIVSDIGGTWGDRVGKVNSTYGDLLAPAIQLLERAALNDIQPRVSNNQALAANRIHGKYAEVLLFYSPVLKDKGAWKDPTAAMQYKCLTDACPDGAPCVPLFLREEGIRSLDRLTLYRTFLKETRRWALKTKHFKRRATKLNRQYQRAEVEFIKAIENLPERIYAIDAYIPRG